MTKRRPYSIRMRKERETLTIYVNITHLLHSLKPKLRDGIINPYNISWYSLRQEIRNNIRNYEKHGYKTVFVHNKKNVILRINR